METSPTALRNKIVKAIVKILGAKLVNLLPKDARANFREYLLVALEDEEEEVQDAAINGLAVMGGDDAAAGIFSIAAKLDPDQEQDRLDHIISSLAQMGVTAVLKNALRNDDAHAAQLAVEVLARCTSPEVESVLLNAFWQNPIAVQRAIVVILAQIAGRDSVDFFMDLIAKHNDGKVLKAAASFLGQKLHYAPAADILFELLDHQYDDVKEAGLDACVAIGGEEMQGRFRKLFSGIDPMKRLMAVYALGRIDASSNMDLLKTAMEDENPEIRKHALKAVASQCHDSSVWTELLAPRLFDENRDVRQTVVELMGDCFCPEIVPHLLSALNDEDDWVKVRALEVLGQRKIVEAIPAVMSQLENPNKLVAIRAIECLGAIGGTAAFQALLSISGGDDYELMDAAESAIARIQDEQEGNV